MKKIIKILGLFSLIGFSFFYTDKVIDVALEQDEIMIKINNIKENYKISPSDATITENGMIPGINGKKINVEGSYNNMRSIGLFQENYLVFDKIKPNISIYDYYHKKIIQGNSAKHMVSLVFIIKDEKYIEEIYNLTKEKNIKIDFFVDYNFLNTHTNMLKKLENITIHSYGTNGIYSPDILLFSKNLIERITKKETDYCLEINKNQAISICTENKMFTITPNIIAKNNLYNEIKTKLQSGSIILIDTNTQNIENLKVSIDYIKAKGLTIGHLSELINEEIPK